MVWTAVSMVPYAVIMMTPVSGLRRRTWARTSSPERSGIFWSTSTTSKRSCSNRARAERPSAAVTTS
jgi:hypothetical protein